MVPLEETAFYYFAGVPFGVTHYTACCLARYLGSPGMALSYAGTF